MTRQELQDALAKMFQDAVDRGGTIGNSLSYYDPNRLHTEDDAVFLASIADTIKFNDERSAINEILRTGNIKYFYHFTSRKNLTSIRQNDGLYSWKYLKSHNIDIPVQGGDEWSQSLDERNGIADYVRLSFCNDHPMAHRHIQNGEDIVVLKISTDVATIDGTMFSNMNAVDSRCHCAPGVDGLKQVSYAATQEKYLRNDDPWFKYKQAEILVKTHVPLKYILNIDEF